MCVVRATCVTGIVMGDGWQQMKCLAQRMADPSAISPSMAMAAIPGLASSQESFWPSMTAQAKVHPTVHAPELHVHSLPH